jgi:hypothetical protein
MTHELVSHMLGVRRESITVVAQTLQAEGAIKYRRGHITVVNRKLMEDRVSEGYAVLKKEYRRLLSNKPEIVTQNLCEARPYHF